MASQPKNYLLKKWKWTNRQQQSWSMVLVGKSAIMAPMSPHCMHPTYKKWLTGQGHCSGARQPICHFWLEQVLLHNMPNIGRISCLFSVFWLISPRWEWLFSEKWKRKIPSQSPRSERLSSYFLKCDLLFQAFCITYPDSYYGPLLKQVIRNITFCAICKNIPSPPLQTSLQIMW